MGGNPINNYDPNGLTSLAACANPLNAAACAAAGIGPAAVSGASTGAIVSGGINAASQIANGCKFDWGELGKAAGYGAISGAFFGGVTSTYLKLSNTNNFIKFYSSLPKVKPIKASGGDIVGWTIGRGYGYGARPRIDYHMLYSHTKGLINFAKGRRLVHYHRRGLRGIGLHRPWQGKPSWKWYEFYKKF